jgi:hypothetical protein
MAVSTLTGVAQDARPRAPLAPSARRSTRTLFAPAPAAPFAAFLLMAILASQRYGGLLAHPPRGRLLAEALLAGAFGGVLVATARLPRPAARAARALLVALAALAAAALAGVAPSLLEPGHWGALGAGWQRGWHALAAWSWPYRGGDAWGRRLVVLAVPAMLMLAAALAFWPRGARWQWPGRLAALSVLITLYLTGVLNGSQTSWRVEGLLVLAILAAWLFPMVLSGPQGVRAGIWLGLAAAAALTGSALTGRTHAVIDYRAWRGATPPLAFQWDQLYGPLNWPRDDVTVLRVVAARAEPWRMTTLDRFDGLRFLRSINPPPTAALDIWAGREQRRWYEAAEVSVGALRSAYLASPGTAVRLQQVPDAQFNLAADANGDMQARAPLANGAHYRVIAYVPHPTPAQLRAAPRAYPALYLPYTAIQLPSAEPVGAAAGQPRGLGARRGGRDHRGGALARRGAVAGARAGERARGLALRGRL